MSENRSASPVTLEDLLTAVASAVRNVDGTRTLAPAGGTVTIGIVLTPGAGGGAPGQDTAHRVTADLDQRFADEAGAIHGLFFERFLASRAAARSQRSADARSALDALRAKGHLPPADADHVARILSLVSDASKTDPEIAASIDAAADELRRRTASPLAIAITNIALDSIHRAVRKGRPPTAPPTGDDPVAHADVEGGIVGAILGSEVPGLGTVFGGLLGASLSSLAEAL